MYQPAFILLIFLASALGSSMARADDVQKAAPKSIFEGANIDLKRLSSIDVGAKGLHNSGASLDESASTSDLMSLTLKDLELMSLPSGIRKFDDLNEAAPSLKDSRRALERAERMRKSGGRSNKKNSKQNPNLKRRYNDQVMNSNRNYNRKSYVERRGGKGRAAESRKRPRRPEVKSRSQSEEDDVFKEDDDESAVERRADEEEEEMDDADERQDVDQSAPRRSKGSRLNAAAASGGRQRKVKSKLYDENEETSGEEEDPNSESSNLEKTRSKAKRRAGRAPADRPGVEKKSELEAGDINEEASNQLIDKSSRDLETAAGSHHKHSHGHYHQYAGVPKKKAWKFGFKRGNHKHTIERHEKGYKNKFHSSFKWHAKEKCKKKKKCKSVGKMTWDYKHHDKKKHHHG